MSFSPQPVPSDSTNERQHRGQLANAVNALLKRVFEEDSAIRQTIVDLSDTVGDNSAAIASEAFVRATADDALAGQITTLTATVGGNTAAISAEVIARANGDSALATSITNLTATVNGNTSAISTEATTRANADSALSTSITNLSATVSGNTAAISSEATTRANADSALSSSISTLSTTVGGNTASISTLTSSVNGLKAEWGVSIDVGGNIVGAIKLDGSASSSTFKVTASDFQVVQSGSSVPAFQIVGGTAYLNVPLVSNFVSSSNIASGAASYGYLNNQSSAVTCSATAYTEIVRVNNTSLGGVHAIHAMFAQTAKADSGSYTNCGWRLDARGPGSSFPGTTIASGTYWANDAGELHRNVFAKINPGVWSNGDNFDIVLMIVGDGSKRPIIDHSQLEALVFR